MNITEEYGLPFVKLTIVFRGRELEMNRRSRLGAWTTA